jgi:Mg2+ and Co2+ transporter CorA
LDIEKTDKILNGISSDHAEDSSKSMLSSYKIKTEELLEMLRFVKSVCDSTDGYTSSEEEDETYDSISRDLGSLIDHLLSIDERINTYTQDDDFTSVKDF